jgi:hypothetical protein
MAGTATAVQTAVTLSNMAATAAEQTGGGLSNGGGAGTDGQPKGRELFTDEVLALNCLHQTCCLPHRSLCGLVVCRILLPEVVTC